MTMIFQQSSMIKKRETSKLFIEKYFDLLTLMKTYSNDNDQFKMFIRKNQMLRKANRSIFLKMWYEHITIPYFNEIMGDNVEYFLQNDFDEELSKTGGSEYNIKNAVIYMKSMYHKMTACVVDEFTQRIKELTILSYVYNNSQ